MGENRKFKHVMSLIPYKVHIEAMHIATHLVESYIFFYTWNFLSEMVNNVINAHIILLCTKQEVEL